MARGSGGGLHAHSPKALPTLWPTSTLYWRTSTHTHIWIDAHVHVHTTRRNVNTRTEIHNVMHLPELQWESDLLSAQSAGIQSHQYQRRNTTPRGLFYQCLLSGERLWRKSSLIVGWLFVQLETGPWADRINKQRVLIALQQFSSRWHLCARRSS